MRKQKFILFLVAALLLSTTVMAKNGHETWTKKKATQWVKSGDWAGSLKLKADKSVNAVEFANQYHQNKAAWDLVFNWLKSNNPETVAVGKYVLDSANVSVTVTDAPSVRAFDLTKWEGHCQKIDLQYIARGKEKMGIAPITKSRVVTPYDAKKDNGFYDICEKDANYVVAQPGTFLLFFPSDAHRPNIKVEGCDTVKKIVFKIRAVTNVNPKQREADEIKQQESQK
jgi:biofilm protein TabA